MDTNDYLHRAWAYINLDNLIYNLNSLSSFIDLSKTSIMAVVKANAYGHEDVVISKCLQDNGIHYFAVSNIDEAIKLRKNGIKGEILILGYTPPELASEISSFNLVQTIVSLNFAQQLSHHSKKNNVSVRCHIAIDTGMGRIGLPLQNESDMSQSIDEIIRISGMNNIIVEGIFTHFTSADSPSKTDLELTHTQANLFFELCDYVESKGISLKHRHCLNSAASIYSYDNRSTLSRLGIVLYGLKPDSSRILPAPLKPVMQIKSIISCLKTVPPGYSVSYGRTFHTSQKTIIATIPIGYADGIPRLLSNNGYISINGQKAPIIGRICMDQLMVDVTSIDSISENSSLFNSPCSPSFSSILCKTTPSSGESKSGSRIERIRHFNAVFVISLLTLK